MKLTGGKDTDKIVLELLSDRDLFSLMQTDKKYLNLGQEFFKKRMERKYPLLSSKKPENMTWAKYYIEMVYYIAKLEEKHEIPYIPSPNFDPEEFYNYVEKITKDPIWGKSLKWQVALRYAAESGRKDLIDYILDKDFTPSYLDMVMRIAAKKGDLELVKYMVKKGAVVYTSAIELAEENAHSDIVNYLNEIKLNNL